MRKLLIAVVAVAVLAGVAVYSGFFSREPTAAAGSDATFPGGPAGGGPPGAAGRGGARGGGRFGGGPLTVELATARRGTVSQRLVVVGNLIGDATVSVVPRVAGRLQEVYVKLGDRVTMGQRIAKIEDQELREQLRQAEAALEVSRATIRQREADLQLAKTSVERSRSLFERQLLPRQTLDDNEARFQSANAALDLARAQASQTSARLEELRITMTNTLIVSPVDGFVARRAADPGAFASQNAPVVDVVDISSVRLVVNIVEKDLKQLQAGDEADVEVDAYPGETFVGRIARVAPVLDPATRTAPIEIEIPNPGYRLKPGMYARVSVKTEEHNDALVIPANALVDVGGERGVYLAQDDNTAAFQKVEIGIEEPAQVEILAGLDEGQRVVTTGAAALTDGAQFLLQGTRNGGAGRGGRAGRGNGANGAPQGAPRGAAPPEGQVSDVGARGGQRGQAPAGVSAGGPAGANGAVADAGGTTEGRRGRGRGARGAGSPAGQGAAGQPPAGTP